MDPNSCGSCSASVMLPNLEFGDNVIVPAIQRLHDIDDVSVGKMVVNSLQYPYDEHSAVILRFLLDSFVKTLEHDSSTETQLQNQLTPNLIQPRFKTLITDFSAIISFGDSSLDVGNNDFLSRTVFKSNYPPYGRDFGDQKPTGRFCNGKLVGDITADSLGFTTYPRAYLSPQATGKNLLIGANFASAASGYDDKTAFLRHAISLSQQMRYFKEYQSKLAAVTGSTKAAFIIKEALYLACFGTADFLQNYYVNPKINKIYTPDQYSTYLVGKYSSFIKDLYGLGARRVGVTSLPPLGCLPAVKTFFGLHEKGCVSRINTVAQGFNKKLNLATEKLKKQLPDLKITVFDIFNTLYDVILSPTTNGFLDASRGCCGTGAIPVSLFCNRKYSTGSCSNASEYVFWDGIHPTEIVNQVLLKHEIPLTQQIDYYKEYQPKLAAVAKVQKQHP
ncbi:GDSL esterase/lipase APG [Heracleum sosnowskyi]|uniref:GDSL esterase/lipase APG n=1 Tax=Heracleum sosnowskyi TaxID=360622 RepID=A0AAD8H5S0_9APIA|nr:GDSL esterase/lipase APG [Heracleum sosnowskyi]